MNVDTAALVGCIGAWKTDLTLAFSKIDVPTLIIHGDKDRLLPISAAQDLHESIEGSQLVIIEGGSHGMNWTLAENLNSHLLAFLNGVRLRF